MSKSSQTTSGDGRAQTPTFAIDDSVLKALSERTPKCGFVNVLNGRKVDVDNADD
jgi:hypothetical protein